jgi:hypothetical protein
MRRGDVSAVAAAAVAALALSPVSAAAATAAVKPIVTPAKVEKMIRRSIAPLLAANLGEGSTMSVTCKTTGRKTLRCVAVLIPGDTSMSRIRVIYSVACVSSVACRWTPIG